MTQIDRHPLLEQAYHVCLAIEECGASVQLTNAVTKASALLRDLDNFIDKPGPFHTLEEDFQHFLSCSGLSSEYSDVIDKLRIAFSENWKPHSPLPRAAQEPEKPVVVLGSANSLHGYLMQNLDNGLIDFSVRCTHINNEGAHFYIHPANVSGETLQFIVQGNTLTKA